MRGSVTNGAAATWRSEKRATSAPVTARLKRSSSCVTGRTSALPPITWSSKREFRLIRPLVYVTENLTRSFAELIGAPVIPCGCSQKTGTVLRTLRDMLAEIEKDHPFLKETLLSAMGKIEPGRLLDTRFLDLEENRENAELAAGELVVLQSA